MNNTCRIASGYLGALLARQRPTWDFHDEPLTENGRSALCPNALLTNLSARVPY